MKSIPHRTVHALGLTIRSHFAVVRESDHGSREGTLAVDGHTHWVKVCYLHYELFVHCDGQARTDTHNALSTAVRRHLP